MDAPTVTITDPELLAKLTGAPGFVEIRDPSGRVLGTFFLDGYGVPPPGVKSPFSDAEFEEARKSPSSGITLDEFFQKLERGEWK